MSGQSVDVRWDGGTPRGMGGGDHVSVGAMVQGSKNPRFHHASVDAMVQGSKSPRFHDVNVGAMVQWSKP